MAAVSPWDGKSVCSATIQVQVMPSGVAAQNERLVDASVIELLYEPLYK